MITALEGVDRSASRLGRSLPPGKTRYPFYRRLDELQGRSGQVRKISPSTGFDPRTVQPLASRYTDWATRPTGLPVKYPLFLSYFNLNSLDSALKYIHVLKFNESASSGAKFFHADGQTDRHDEANSHFSQFCERAKNLSKFWNILYITSVSFCATALAVLLYEYIVRHRNFWKSDR